MGLKMKQISIFGIWTPGHIKPNPGQNVLHIYGYEDGTVSDVITGVLISKGETDYPMYNGKPAQKPCIWWMPLPEHPEPENIHKIIWAKGTFGSYYEDAA